MPLVRVREVDGTNCAIVEHDEHALVVERCLALNVKDMATRVKHVARKRNEHTCVRRGCAGEPRIPFGGHQRPLLGRVGALEFVELVVDTPFG